MITKDEFLKIAGQWYRETVEQSGHIRGLAGRLEAAGAFAEQRPTYEQVWNVMTDGIDSISGHSASKLCIALVDAGLVQPKHEPGFSEDDVRELAEIFGQGPVQEGSACWVYAKIAVRAGYRKAQP